MSDSALKSQVGGEHYSKLKIQPVEYIMANNLDFISGCIIKYATRHESKGGKQDIEKIKHFCDLLIELKYKDDNGEIILPKDDVINNHLSHHLAHKWGM